MWFLMSAPESSAGFQPAVSQDFILPTWRLLCDLRNSEGFRLRELKRLVRRPWFESPAG